MSGRQNYHFEMTLPPFVLPAGDYIFSTLVIVTGGDWNWVETDWLLGSAIYAVYTSPGQYFEVIDFGTPFTTGSLAFDIFAAGRCLGDLDADWLINAADLELFASCLAGPEIGTPEIDCDHFAESDFDDDNDVDLLDFAQLQRATGSQCP